jgi:hypothetical protein
MRNCRGRRNMGLMKTGIGVAALGQSTIIIRYLQAGLKSIGAI